MQTTLQTIKEVYNQLQNANVKDTYGLTTVYQVPDNLSKKFTEGYLHALTTRGARKSQYQAKTTTNEIGWECLYYILKTLYKELPALEKFPSNCTWDGDPQDTPDEDALSYFYITFSEINQINIPELIKAMEHAINDENWPDLLYYQGVDAICFCIIAGS